MDEIETMGVDVRHDTCVGHPEFEWTFGLIKTHIAQDRRLTSDVFAHMLYRLPSALAIFDVRRVLSASEILALYGEHSERPYWNVLSASVSGPVIPIALGGPSMVTKWRKLLGATDPKRADIFTLRKTWGSMTEVADNVAHGSDSLSSARRELAIFFPKQIRIWGET